MPDFMGNSQFREPLQSLVLGVRLASIPSSKTFAVQYLYTQPGTASLLRGIARGVFARTLAQERPCGEAPLRTIPLGSARNLAQVLRIF